MKRTVNYGPYDMKLTITQEEALGYLILAASRHLHYQKVETLYDEMIEVMRRYSCSDAQYKCVQVWTKKVLEEKNKR